ncbi:MAG TPA: hypothetical protein VFW11_15620 [Cyclobacteriaceae bacterium]|nr:hypothetical protein [Cyclobacteriaceae bacterium]
MDNQFFPSIMVSVLTLACAVIVIGGIRKAVRFTNWSEAGQKTFFLKSVVTIVLWVIVVGVLSLTGFFSLPGSLPPRPVLIILVSLVTAILLARSVKVSELLSVTPLQWLVYIQSFRIFVELILWQGYLRGLLPVQMTFEGSNFDILSGLLAIPAGWMISHNPASSRVVGIVYNVVGIILLVNILTIAVLSMPTPFRYFMNEPSNVIVGEFPFIYIPGAFVVLAIFMHVFSLRQLALMKKQNFMQSTASTKS